MQGDVWQLPNGQEGLEVARHGPIRMISVINPSWPFPSPPQAYHKDELRKMPSRYLNGAVPEEFEDATF